MKKNDREQRIISILDSKREMSVEELSSTLNISPSTLRKQLADMQKRGLIIRTYGGVLSVDPVADESFDSKMHKSSSEKLRIAIKARTLINEGASVAMGSGTSVYALANAMNDLSRGTVYTNSMQVAEYLGPYPALEVHVCGGIIRSHTGTMIGNDVTKFFEKLSIDIAFVGCDAIDSAGNVCSDNLATATSEHAVISRAKKTFVLCDSSKIGKQSVAVITNLKNVSGLITGIEAQSMAERYSLLTSVIYV